VEDWLCILSSWFALVGLIIWDTCKPSQSPKSENGWLAKACDPMIWFTGMLAFFTLGLVYVADKTDATLRDTLATNQSTQRAFLTVKDLRIDGSSDQANATIQAWHFTPIIENSGNTPTKDLRFNMMIDGGPTEPEEGWTAPYPGVDLPDGPVDPEIPFKRLPLHGRAVLGPKSQAPAVFGNSTIGAELLKKTMTSHWHFYVYGVFHYHDIFPMTSEHVTKYCYAIGTSFKNDQVVPRFGLCSHWNCADSECESDRKEWENEVRAAFAKAGKKIPKNSIPFGDIAD
jgi:hypothetical protein